MGIGEKKNWKKKHNNQDHSNLLKSQGKDSQNKFREQKKTHPPHVYPLCIKIVFQLLEIELLVLQLAHGMSLSHDANVHTHHGTLASIPSILRRGERGSLGLRRRRRMSLRRHHVE